jgi:hypothetical protein
MTAREGPGRTAAEQPNIDGVRSKPDKKPAIPGAAPQARSPAKFSVSRALPSACENRFDKSLERDDFSSIRHLVLSFCLSMIFSENRCPLFRIML